MAHGLFIFWIKADQPNNLINALIGCLTGNARKDTRGRRKVAILADGLAIHRTMIRANEAIDDTFSKCRRDILQNGCFSVSSRQPIKNNHPSNLLNTQRQPERRLRQEAFRFFFHDLPLFQIGRGQPTVWTGIGIVDDLPSLCWDHQRKAAQRP